jgi:hypothetical protein
MKMQFVITAYDGEGMLDKRMELKACPFQLDDYAKFASELDTIIETLKNKEK